MSLPYTQACLVRLQGEGSLGCSEMQARIQEMSDQVPKGHIPRTMSIHIRGELTRKVSQTCTVVKSECPRTFGLSSSCILKPLHVPAPPSDELHGLVALAPNKLEDARDAEGVRCLST